jgi:hypothetical protein
LRMVTGPTSNVSVRTSSNPCHLGLSFWLCTPHLTLQ